VLGQFPRLCYDELLRPLADKAGIAVVCTPYELGPNHNALAESTEGAFEVAIAAGAARYGWDLDRMPRLSLGHSLGAKLQVLLRCRAAARPSSLAPHVGVGLLAFNNFGVEDQVRLLREILQSIQGRTGAGGPNQAANSFFERVLEPVIGRVAKVSGMGFQPGPDELLDMVADTYGATTRTCTFSFDDDNLDCSMELQDALRDRGALGVGQSMLRGGHLTPVVLSLEGVSQAARDAPGIAGQVADRFGQQFSGGGIGLGDQDDLEALIDELVSWVRGV